MMETEIQMQGFSSVEKGRELLQQGDVSSAIECYGKIFDPDSLDEDEARNMLIEARSHLSRKYLLEALESFEEALIMGTDVQRRQALEGISTIGEIRSKLKSLTPEVKKGFKQLFGKKASATLGISLISDEENVVLVAREALDRLPATLAKSAKLQRVPPHLSDQSLPVATDICVCYTEEADVHYIVEIARHLAAKPKN
jgi:hypothetical protein